MKALNKKCFRLFLFLSVSIADQTAFTSRTPESLTADRPLENESLEPAVVSQQDGSSSAPSIVTLPPLLFQPAGSAWQLFSARKQYGQGADADSMRREIDGFDCKDSPAYRLVQRHFGDNLRCKELKAILEAIQLYLAQHGTQLPSLSRNTKRSFVLMIKYMQCHLDVIEPILPLIILCDANKQEIPFLDAGKHRVEGTPERESQSGRRSLPPPLQQREEPATDFSTSTRSQFVLPLLSLPPTVDSFTPSPNGQDSTAAVNDPNTAPQ
ncbi:MAG: hypothetical protein LBJ03_03150 [Holosporales bacterium]|jgi:hypothetical protein|nr:hypothetical protein [Holosporales bacterium]